jgi:hypothetical protein
MTAFASTLAGDAPLLVVLDIKVTVLDKEGRGLERCLVELEVLGRSTVIAWLVSTETPASIRQVRMSSALVSL